MAEKKKIIIFGTGKTGRNVYEMLRQECRVICFLDNDKRLEGQTYDGKRIYPPTEKLLMDGPVYDEIVVASIMGSSSIRRQLESIGVPSHKIDCTSIYRQQTYLSYEARKTFLESFSILAAQRGIRGACAEAGVYCGQFASEINRCFPDRGLYLFDTFEGFDQRDVQCEVQNSFSKARACDYQNTSEAMVLEQMPHPENCIIKKGYFPTTAAGIREEFCFVNLDMDLYQPTREGLAFFGEHMVLEGVILVHDFFSETYLGVRQAVEEYMTLEPGKRLLPVGDGVSVAVVGF